MTSRITLSVGLIAAMVWCATCSKSPNSSGNGGPTNPPADTAGVSWTPGTLPNTPDAYDVVWGSNKFVVVSMTGGAVSSDGGSWTATGGFLARKCKFGNGTFVAAVTGSNGGSNTVWRSVDGTNWQNTSFSYTVANWVLDCVLYYDATGFTLYGTHFPGFGLVATSADGSSWTVTDSLPMTDVRTGFAVNPGNAGDYVQLYFDCIISGPSYIDTLAPIASALELHAAVFGNGWVIVADSGIIFHSSDAQNWNRVTTPVSGTVKHLRQVVWTGTYFVAVGDVGTILTSPDGTTWTQRTSGTTMPLRGIAWSGSKLVIVGASGTVLRSP